jgi:hypothetical protein
MKSKKNISAINIIVLCLISTVCSLNLPKEIKNLLDDKYNHYDIVSYEKAPFPENFPGFWGQLAAKDEVWCLVIETSDWGISNKLYYRLGGLWSENGISYQQVFEQLGCNNHQ